MRPAQRDADHRAHAERFELLEHLGARVRGQMGQARDVVYPSRPLGVRRRVCRIREVADGEGKALAELAEARLARGIDVHADGLAAAVASLYVHDAGVAEEGQREARDLRQGVLVDERRRQQRSRIREEAHRFGVAALLRHVLDGADDEVGSPSASRISVAVSRPHTIEPSGRT